VVGPDKSAPVVDVEVIGVSLDTAASVTDVIYRLGFATSGDFSDSSWVTAAELYQWGDEAAKRLARETGAFVTFDESIALAPGTASYRLPSAHVYTVMAWAVYADGSGQLLRLTSVGDLWALDGNWQTTTGDARRVSLDAGGPGTITVYPIPIEAGTLWQALEKFPATISAAASTVSLPTVMQDFFSYRMLAGARGKESPQADLAMAQHFSQRADLYTQIATYLFGGSQ
jgi:hypothetical protein